MKVGAGVLRSIVNKCVMLNIDFQPQRLHSPDFCATKQPCQLKSLKSRYTINKGGPTELMLCYYSSSVVCASASVFILVIPCMRPTVYFQLSARKCGCMCVRSDELIVAL